MFANRTFPQIDAIVSPPNPNRSPNDVPNWLSMPSYPLPIPTSSSHWLPHEIPFEWQPNVIQFPSQRNKKQKYENEKRNTLARICQILIETEFPSIFYQNFAVQIVEFVLSRLQFVLCIDQCPFLWFDDEENIVEIVYVDDPCTQATGCRWFRKYFLRIKFSILPMNFSRENSI